MKLNRNDECWCGSKQKYKKCHMAFDEKLMAFEKQGYIIPDRGLIKTKEQVAAIKESAKINDGALDAVAEQIKVGMTTEMINTIVHEYTIAHGAVPAPLGYSGFPKSVCTSINNEICHGIPSEERVLEAGDIINVDVSTIYNGYFSDASRMFMIGEVSPESKRLVEVARECLIKGIEAVKPWCCLGDVGEAVESYANAHGYSVVREYGGHGIGLAFHEEPFVAHYRERNERMLIVPGMMFTVEPMINEGASDLYIDEEDEWTSYTEDGKLSAQWEHMILVTEDGVEIIAK